MTISPSPLLILLILQGGAVYALLPWQRNNAFLVKKTLRVPHNTFFRFLANYINANNISPGIYALPSQSLSTLIKSQFASDHLS